MTAATIFLVFLPGVLAGIVTRSQHVEVVEGHDVNLTCLLEADDGNDTEVFWAWRPVNWWAKNAYIWGSLSGLGTHWRQLSKHFNDSRVSFTGSGKNRSVAIYDIQLADAGEFLCSMTECIRPGISCEDFRRYRRSSWSAVHNLTVAAPARIKGSGNGTVTKAATGGKSMRLSCVVSGKSPISVKWFIDDEEAVDKWGRAVGAKFRGVSIDRDRTWSNIHYMERNMSTRHEGTYKCEATNELGADELTFSVKVTEPPVMDRSVERRFMVAEGEDVTLKCRITSKPAPLLPGRPVIRWFRNRIVVKTETQSTNESIYTVPKATWADGGKYSCIATNADVSASIDYIVMVKPEVSGSLTLLAPIAEIRVPAHAWFTLRCTAIGYPLPGIRWTLDGQPIGDGSSEEEPYAVSNGGLTLTVKNFTLKRAVFECLAENRAGTANETFVVATLG